ncbi:MAG TPA: MBL fold metallo-hydrolase [Phycisphaerae bacterium]|nr:MBL fold metallo-hydrolase [Phycisphaerae bacterium]
MSRLVEHLLGDLRLIGYSVAGEETVIACPELNVCFDVGRAPPEVVPIDHVLLTHGHMDHAAGIAYYFSQRNFVGNAPGCVLVPKALADPIRALLQVWGRIEGHVTLAKIVGMGPNEDYELRRGLIARTFEINHGVPSLGFCVIDVRQKLKPEFMDKTGPELVELKKLGIEIQNRVEVPLVAYGGDTAEGAWLENPMVRSAKVLILECTFFEADHVSRARAGFHLHVRDVARIMQRLENEHIVLSHVTRRTGMRDAKQALAKLVPAETLSRVRFLMDYRRAREERETREKRASETGNEAAK